MKFKILAPSITGLVVSSTC